MVKMHTSQYENICNYVLPSREWYILTKPDVIWTFEGNFRTILQQALQEAIIDMDTFEFLNVMYL